MAIHSRCGANRVLLVFCSLGDPNICPGLDWSKILLGVFVGLKTQPSISAEKFCAFKGVKKTAFCIFLQIFFQN